MKRFLICLTILCTMLSANADFPYKNIKDEAKLKIFEDTWTTKVNRNDVDYFIKFVSDGSGSYSEFYKSTGDFAFTTGCQYEFINNGNLIGYSNQDLKFYDFSLSGNELTKRVLTEEEVQALFPDYKIIRISDFSPNTHSLKIKKDKRNFKLIVLNDTNRTFYHYSFSSGNAKFQTNELAGFIEISKKGMIQFSHFGDNTESYPWFILLVR